MGETWVTAINAWVIHCLPFGDPWATRGQPVTTHGLLMDDPWASSHGSS